MRNYWLIFFTFGSRKGCKIILSRRSKKERPSRPLLLIITNVCQTDVPNPPARFHDSCKVLLFSYEMILKLFRV